MRVLFDQGLVSYSFCILCYTALSTAYEEHLVYDIVPASINIPVLPLLCFESIVKYTLAMDMSARHRLARVCRCFNQLVNKQQKPRIYLNDSVCWTMGMPYEKTKESINCFDVSMSRLVRHAGRGSALVSEVKSQFLNPRWFHSWLTLKFNNFGWYTVDKVYWR